MNSPHTSPLIVWALTDNKPGHRNQLEGLISALSELRTTKVKWLSIKKHSQGLIDTLTQKSPPGHTPDVLIAAGHRTHLQLLALKRTLKKPAVVLMKPSLPLSWFDLCLIPRHDKVTRTTNVIETLGPVNRIHPTDDKTPNSGLIVLGGHSKHFIWDTADVMQQVQHIIQRSPQTHWKIATSRRTPNDIIEQIRLQLPYISLKTPAQTDNNWLSKTMQHSEQIWGTQDSISMIYEAITSGAEVNIMTLRPHKKSRVAEEMQRLLDEGRVGNLMHPMKGKSHALPPLDEATRCATQLLERLGL